MCLVLVSVLREEHRIRLIENRMLRTALKSKTAEMIRGWGELRKEEPQNVY
jgi:hypothetical protein